MTSNFDQVCIIHVSVWQTSYIATPPLVSAMHIFNVALKYALLHNIKSFNVISLQLKQANLVNLPHKFLYIVATHVKNFMQVSHSPYYYFTVKSKSTKSVKYQRLFQPQLF